MLVILLGRLLNMCYGEAGENRFSSCAMEKQGVNMLAETS